jgi:hypothetical protein
LTISSLELPPRCLHSVTSHGRMFRDQKQGRIPHGGAARLIYTFAAGGRGRRGTPCPCLPR